MYTNNKYPFISLSSRIFCIAFIVLAFPGNIFAQQKTLLKQGDWLGFIVRTDSNKIQFNFEVTKEAGKTIVHIINADERLLVDDISQEGDSILITLPFFNASLLVRASGTEKLKGFYIKGSNDKKIRVPFEAYYGIKQRFPGSVPYRYNVGGAWDVDFIGRNNTVSKAIGSFVQNANGVVTGSFLTPTGDYRYLQGVVSGDTLKLSGFDGGFASSFEAIIKNDSTIVEGKYFSGGAGLTLWIAHKNDKAQLPDEFGYSKLRAGESQLDFAFKDTDGKLVSIKDARFKNKVVIVQILGSWCPNCMDETRFLSAYYNKNKQRGIEIIGLAYERYDNFEASKKALSVYQKRFQVQYPFLITGVTPSDPQRVEKTLPQIDKIAAFPTSIFIDKKGNVRKIHTGYDGPGTGKFFEAFKVEFNSLVNTLLNEK
jgi:thiol-disulfide isomerase/thioredoxin